MDVVRFKSASLLNPGCFLVLALLGVLASIAQADPLLEMLEAEAGKVESGASTVNIPGEESNNNNITAEADNDDEAREAFESMLDTRYHGSFIFYEKLPNRMQLEIYQDYLAGLDINALRSKIISRYLQQ